MRNASRVSEQGDHSLYRQRVEEIRACVGNDREVPDFPKALEIQNAHCGLGMDDTDFRILGMVYGELGNTRRFAEEKHLAERYHSNSAAHSLFAVTRMDEIMRRAQANYGAEENAEFKRIRRRAGCGIIMHDVGESFGEIASLAQLVAHPGRKKDIPEIERMVTHYVLTRAAFALQTQDEAFFRQGVSPLRGSFDNIRESGDIPTTEQFQRLLDTQPLPGLNHKSARHVQRWLRYYDMAESQDGFLTHFIKNCEHIQGTRHLLRFGERDALPFAQATSNRLLANFKYIENNLGDMFDKARTKNELALARSTRDIVYKTAIEILERGPDIIDHTSRRRMIEIYRRALAADYRPRPKEILATSSDMPEALDRLAPRHATSRAR